MSRVAKVTNDTKFDNDRSREYKVMEGRILPYSTFLTIAHSLLLYLKYATVCQPSFESRSLHLDNFDTHLKSYLFGYRQLHRRVTVVHWVMFNTAPNALLPRSMQCVLATITLSICPSNAWYVTKRKEVVPILIPHEKSFILVLWQEEWLVGVTPSIWNIGSNWPCGNENADFQWINFLVATQPWHLAKKFN